jgi:hypothetical protein
MKKTFLIEQELMPYLLKFNVPFDTVQPDGSFIRIDMYVTGSTLLAFAFACKEFGADSFACSLSNSIAA